MTVLRRSRSHTMTVLEQVHRDVTGSFGLKPLSNWPLELSEALKGLQTAYELDEEELLRRIGSHQGIRREIAGSLTVGESYFYRHTEHFKLFSEHLQGRLADRNGEPIVVWSAGCARGEEPYSLAMAVQEHFGTAFKGRLTIFGIDLNCKAIDAAQEAVYSNWSFRDFPSELKKRYFRELKDGRFEVLEELRTCVRFVNLAIEEYASTQPPATVDTIFFRNVGIYLDPRALQRTYEMFFHTLREGGLLVVTATDPNPPAELFQRKTDRVFSAYHPKKNIAPALPRQKSRPADTHKTPHRQVEPPKPAPHRAVEKASGMRLAELGDELLGRSEFASALRAASALIEQHPASKAGYLLRARIHLANQATGDALRDLRSVVFLDPADKLARYWYIRALECAEVPTQSDNHIRELESQLKRMPAEAPLEDGHTLAGELLREVTAMRKVVK
jgi:chemotaxis protein methyltransferase CheR